MQATAGSSGALSESEKVARVRLIRSENVGPITFFRLLERFGTAVQALRALPDLAKSGGRAATLKIYEQSAAEDEIATADTRGVGMIFHGERAYPPLLTQIDDAPPLLFVRGHRHLLAKRAVAVVGARNASTNGRRFAGAMAAALGQAGYLVVSGMARGIDAAAHGGAMETGTVAVLGGGVDVVYPREHQALYDALLERGALCSEMPLGINPQARHFPRRNRIISGMARGIVVVEAGEKSGSLITTRMALEQGREVFAVPGAPQDPRAKGANTLIREGAQLTETAGDVIAGLRQMEMGALNERKADCFHHPGPETVDCDALTRDRPKIIGALGYTPTAIDDVVRETGCPPGVVTTVLLELELAGRAERLPGNKAALLDGGDVDG